MIRDGASVNELDLLELSSSSADVEMFILDERFTVAFNVPWITSITLPSSILATCYVYPSKLEIHCANSDENTFVWYKGKQVNLLNCESNQN